MRTVIVWWDLPESAQTIESLHAYLPDESVIAFADGPGLRLRLRLEDYEVAQLAGRGLAFAARG